MIWNFIIDFFNSMMAWAAGLIPDVQIDLDLGGYVAPMADLFGYIDTFVSLDVILYCIIAVLIVDNWALIVKMVLKIWELLPLN